MLPRGSRRHRSGSRPLIFSAFSQHCCFTLYGKLLGLKLGFGEILRLSKRVASSSSVKKGVSRREVEEGESLVVERDPDGLGSNPDGPMGRSLAGDDRLRLRSLIGLIFSLTTFLLSLPPPPVKSLQQGPSTDTILPC